LASGIPADEIHVVTVRLPRGLAAINGLAGLLPPDELERAQRFLDPRARLHFMAGRSLLRHLLARRTGIRASRIELTYGRRGKPTAPAADLAFNLSHAGSWLLLALAGQPNLGVDVETRFGPLESAAIARRILGRDERAHLEATLPPRRIALIQRYWVLKEALMKARGDGFACRPITLELTIDGRTARCAGHDGVLMDWRIDCNTRAAVALAASSQARLIHHRPGFLATLLGQTGCRYQETARQ
jgi:4'-phosphopantetheinyl transferase